MIEFIWVFWGFIAEIEFLCGYIVGVIFALWSVQEKPNA